MPKLLMPKDDAATEQVAACVPSGGWLAGRDVPLLALNDEEGARLPSHLPPVIDAHVHLFPDRMLEAIWRWFEQYGWPIRYPLHTPEIIRFQLDRGVSHVIALHYAHRAGIARSLNDYMAAICRNEPRVTGLATVFPGEESATSILIDGFDAGLRGVKIHCHVQCIAPDDPAMMPLYALCEERGLPMVIHAGREPASPHYACDPHALCSADRIERVLETYPRLKLCVPHLGADEFDAYERLLTRHDNLWLDTTMALAGYFNGPLPLRVLHARPERVIYGTDFPILPYAWDRELRQIEQLGLGPERLERLLSGGAIELFDLDRASLSR
jgi:predicted TIM-barrel fold metal-dependent hydrolase